MTENFPAFLLPALLLISAFFSASEGALFSLARMEIRRLIERHPRRGKLVNDLLLHPRRALITILIGNNIVNTAAAAIATLVALHLFGPGGVGLFIAGFTVILIFACDVVPKVFAVQKNETVALASAPLLEIFSLVLFPLRRLIQILSDWVLSLILHEKKVDSTGLISAQELKMLVKIGEEEGILNREERRMIQKLFELGEKPVRTIMTPRTDLVALDLNASWEKQLEIIKNFHFSYFPVYQGSSDQIVGILSTQEVVLSGDRELQKFLKPPFYIPELKRIDDLLHELQDTGERFAVCVDEFGGTAGVVTLEDVLEEIFGEFYDEYTKAESPIRELGMGEFLVDAKISLTEFNEFFHSDFHSKEVKTLGGLIFEKMGRVPRKGDVLDLPYFRVRIHDMARQRILKVVVRSTR